METKRIRLDVKPLSVNDLYRGRRFATQELKDYRWLCRGLLKGEKGISDKDEKREYKLDYCFFLSKKSYSRTDVANLEKGITDILVEEQIIPDDRYCIDNRQRKFRAEEDYIEINIEYL